MNSTKCVCVNFVIYSPDSHQDACQTLLKRLQPIIKKNPTGTWNDWVRPVNPTECV